MLEMRIRDTDGVVHVKNEYQPPGRVAMIITRCSCWYSLIFHQAEEYMAKETQDAPTCLWCLVGKEAFP